MNHEPTPEAPNDTVTIHVDGQVRLSNGETLSAADAVFRLAEEIERLQNQVAAQRATLRRARSALIEALGESHGDARVRNALSDISTSLGHQHEFKSWRYGPLGRQRTCVTCGLVEHE